IDVQDILAKVVPLKVTDQRLLDPAVQAQVNDVRPVTDQAGQFLGGQRDGDRLLLVSVDDARDLSLLAKGAGLASATPLAIFGFQSDRLGHDRFSTSGANKKRTPVNAGGCSRWGKDSRRRYYFKRATAQQEGSMFFRAAGGRERSLRRPGHSTTLTNRRVFP